MTRVAMLVGLGWALALPSYGDPSPAPQEEVRKRVMDIVAAMEPQYAKRAELLKRSTGSCRMDLYFEEGEVDADEMKARLENALGADSANDSLQWQNVAEIAWKQRDGDLRFDVVIQKQTGDQPLRTFPPQNKRSAVSADQSIHYNVLENSAYIDKPPANAANPTSVKNRFEVGALYTFREPALPSLLRDTAEKGILPIITEVTVRGIPCIRLEYTREKRAPNKGDEVLAKTTAYYILAPAQGYSLLEGMASVKSFSEGISQREILTRYYNAEYHECATQPGVWLLTRVLGYMRIPWQEGAADAIKVIFNETEVAVDVPEVEFSFQGLGLPEGTLVDDKRETGKTIRMEYRGGELVPK
ncbi:MAG: hypothetical protein WC655_07680 [Candidatus Hydrogenedentales bacterium]|jgi:hypothetical protein